MFGMDSARTIRRGNMVCSGHLAQQQGSNKRFHRIADRERLGRNSQENVDEGGY